MKFQYKFTNLLGSVFKMGNIVFSHDGNSLISSVGNRVTEFDLTNNKTTTLPFEAMGNLCVLALSPDSSLLLGIDVDGQSFLAHMGRRVVLAHFNFKSRVTAAQFSPNGKYILVGLEKKIQVWKVPKMVKEFAPFVLVRTYFGHYDNITSMCWCPDSKYFMTGSGDRTARIWELSSNNFLEDVQMEKQLTANEEFQQNFRGVLSGHKEAVVGCYLPSPPTSCYTVSGDGTICLWAYVSVDQQKVNDWEKGNWSDEESDEENQGALTGVTKGKGRWLLVEKQFFNRNSRVASCSFTPLPPHMGGVVGGEKVGEEGRMVTVGFNNGVFGLWLLPTLSPSSIAYAMVNGPFCRYPSSHSSSSSTPAAAASLTSTFQLVHCLSMGKHPVSAAAINPSGDWVAFGSQHLGQLVVWEWSSESFILKQQGHYFDTNTLSFSPNGQYIATGSDDGKIKLWNTTTGFCFVTFNDHKAAVNDVEFSTNGTAVYSASSDGTVRAFDLRRYRNFRTMTSPEPRQFSCVAVDKSGEIVCAGTISHFEVYVWSAQTGKIIDVLSGHEGPVSSLHFNPLTSVLTSSSWDKTVRIWDVFARKPKTEILTASADVLCVTTRPDGKEICCSTLKGELMFWDVEGGNLKFTIEGKNDIAGGRVTSQSRTAKNSTVGKSFTTVCYTPDGKCVLAGGNSKYICLYGVEQRVLIKKIQISRNRSLDGVLDILNSKKVTEAGPESQIDDDNDRATLSTPGVRKPDFSKRTVKLQVRSKCVRFSPNGTQWGAATTEGLLVYSLDNTLQFDPYDLDVDVTSSSVKNALKNKEYLKSLVLALRLGEDDILLDVYLGIPHQEVQLVVSDLPSVYLKKMIETIVSASKKNSKRVEFHLLWCMHLLTQHGKDIQKRQREFGPSLRALQKSISTLFSDLSAVADGNSFTLQYLHSLSQMNETNSEQ